MGKIIHRYQGGLELYPSGIELEMDSGEQIVVGNSSSGIKIYENIFFIFPRLIWRCDNSSLVEKVFLTLKDKYIGGHLEQISREIIDKFKTKKDLVSFLKNFKV